MPRQNWKGSVLIAPVPPTMITSAYDGKQNVYADVKPQYHRKKIASDALRKGDGDQREGIPENKIHGRHRGGVKALHKAALSIFCNDGSRKQRHKCKSEYRNAGGKVLYLKHADGNICLYCTQ